MTEKDAVNNALSRIRRGEIAPCYLIYGDEDFLVKETLHRVVDAIFPGGGGDFSLFWMDGEQANIATMYETLITPSLLPGKKVVAVKNTHLFYSKQSSSGLIAEIIEHHENDMPRAAKAFLALLRIIGWRTDDLQNEGWKRISREEWRKAFGEEGEGISLWLPRILDYLESTGLKETGAATEDSVYIEEALLRGLPQGHCLVMTADVVDRRKRLFKIISECGVVLHFPRLKGEVKQKNLLRDIAVRILGERGKRLSPGAFLALGRKTGFHLNDAIQALEKLVAFSGDRSVIQAEDVDAVIARTKEDTIFDLTSALSERNFEKMLCAFRHLIDQGEHYLMILAMVVREVRLLLQAKLLLNNGACSSYHIRMDYSAFQKNVYPEIKNQAQGKNKGMLPGQHPYVVYNALRNAANFTCEDLMRHMIELAEIDRILKSTATDPRHVFERFFAEICRESPGES